jgi:hypothetical protein
LKKWEEEMENFQKNSEQNFENFGDNSQSPQISQATFSAFDKFTESTNQVVVDKKTLELLEENSKLKDTMISVLREKPCIISTGDNAVINATHNTLNVNVYLDQNYDQAMNLHDFVRNLDCSVEDLAVTAANGYVDGMSSLFLRNLDSLDPKTRPIHCGDNHGSQIYIRDANKWEQDKGKLDSEIDNVAKRQILMMSEWEAAHPNWHREEALTHEYLNLVRQLTSGNKDSSNEQIKKNLAKTVMLEEIKDITTTNSNSTSGSATKANTNTNTQDQ